MAAGIEIYNSVLNQKGSPALYSDTLANRPAAGYIGRLFISTSSNEIYRDNGTTWDLISGGGGGVNIYNSDGTLTGTRIMTMAGYNLTFEGGASTARVALSANANIPKILSFRTAGLPRWAFRIDDNETGSNAGANWYLRAYNDAGTFTFSPMSVERSTGEKSFTAIETLSVGSDVLTGIFNVAGGTYGAGLTFIGGNPHGANHNNFTLANSGALSFANSIYLGAQSNVLRLQGNANGTVTMSPSSPGIRTAATQLNQIQWNTTTGAAITYSHASVIQTLGIYRLFAAGSLTVNNAYGLLINDLNEYGYLGTGGGALILTNRWGIYQDSTTDVNYLGGTTLIGTTVNAGYKTDINGTMRVQSTVTLSSLAGIGTRVVTADASGVLSTTVLGSGITGSGTTNYVTKFTSASTVGNSQIFDNGTNVGIGTASPSAKLTVVGVGAQTILNSGSAADARMEFHYNSGREGFISWDTDNLRLQADAGNYLTFFSNAIERLRIFANGRVFIGASPTDAGYQLDINGNLRSVNGANFATTSGNVGVNTASPVMPFQLNNYGGFDGNGNQLIIRNNVYYNTTNARSEPIQTGYQTQIELENLDGKIRFSTSSASNTVGSAASLVERMRITNTGDVILNNGGTSVATISKTGTLYTTLGTNAFEVFVNGFDGYIRTRVASNIIFGINSTNVGIITALGDYGFGTISPINGTSITTVAQVTAKGAGGSAFLYVTNNAQTVALQSYADDTGTTFGTSTNHAVGFRQNGNVAGSLTTSKNWLFGPSGTDSGQTVQIQSSMRLVPTNVVPTASAGAMYYDLATNKLKLYDGTTWVNLN